MSEHDETTGSDVPVVSVDTGETEAKLAAVDAELDAMRPDVHVITLRGADGFDLLHLARGCPESCAVGEAAGRISRAMCETGGRWACDAGPGGLMLLERLGD